MYRTTGTTLVLGYAYGWGKRTAGRGKRTTGRGECASVGGTSMGGHAMSALQGRAESSGELSFNSPATRHTVPAGVPGHRVAHWVCGETTVLGSQTNGLRSVGRAGHSMTTH